MKKILCFLLITIMMFSMTACGDSGKQGGAVTPGPKPQVTEKLPEPTEKEPVDEPPVTTEPPASTGDDGLLDLSTLDYDVGYMIPWNKITTDPHGKNIGDEFEMYTLLVMDYDEYAYNAYGYVGPNDSWLKSHNAEPMNVYLDFVYYSFEGGTFKAQYWTAGTEREYTSDVFKNYHEGEFYTQVGYSSVEVTYAHVVSDGSIIETQVEFRGDDAMEQAVEFCKGAWDYDLQHTIDTQEPT